MIGVMVHRRQVALRCERWRAVDVCAARGRRVNVWASFRQPFCQRSRCNHEAIVIGVMIHRRQVACDVRGSGWSTRAARARVAARSRAGVTVWAAFRQPFLSVITMQS